MVQVAGCQTNVMTFELSRVCLLVGREVPASCKAWASPFVSALGMQLRAGSS